MKLFAYISIVLMLIMCGCSTKKNSFFSRNYNKLNTRYNVYFYGNQALKSGEKNMALRHQEDYTNLLPIFVSNNDQTRSLCVSDMVALGNIEENKEEDDKAIDYYWKSVRSSVRLATLFAGDTPVFYSSTDMDQSRFLQANRNWKLDDEVMPYFNHIATDKFLLKIIGGQEYLMFAISSGAFTIPKRIKGIDSCVELFAENYFKNRIQAEILIGKLGTTAHVFTHEESSKHHIVLAVPFREVNVKRVADER